MSAWLLYPIKFYVYKIEFHARVKRASCINLNATSRRDIHKPVIYTVTKRIALVLTIYRTWSFEKALHAFLGGAINYGRDKRRDATDIFRYAGRYFTIIFYFPERSSNSATFVISPDNRNRFIDSQL